MIYNDYNDAIVDVVNLLTREEEMENYKLKPEEVVFYKGDVTLKGKKGNTELLNAINQVLAELGEEGINALVAQHLGISD